MEQYHLPHGPRKFFFQGDTRGFFQKICKGAKSGGICFFPLETKNTTIFSKNFKNQVPPAPFPTPMICHHLFQF